MKFKFLLSLACFLMLIGNCKAFDADDAKRIADRFYSQLRIISQERYSKEMMDTDRAMNARQRIKDMVCGETIKFPNEFPYFGYGEEAPSLGAFSYPETFWRFCSHSVINRNATVSISYSYDKVLDLNEIKATKNEMSTNFYDVYYKKTISVDGGETRTYHDIIRIYAGEREGLICEMTNESGGGNSETSVSLRGKAALLYANKRYEEAYDAYLKVIEKYNKEGDAYYRLALMTYHNVGCDKYFKKNKKERRKRAWYYAKKAEEYITGYKYMDGVKNLIYTMTYGGV